MKLFLSTLLVIFLNQALAAIPTVEGLFRNSSNREVAGEGIRISYSIEEQQNEILLQKTESESTDKELEVEMLKQKLEPVFIKQSILIGEDGNSLQSIKYIFNSAEMKNNNLINFKFAPSYNAKIISEFDINKRVFESLKAMYLLNNSSIIGTLLREKGNGYKSNKDILDVEKVRLLERYKEYLIATKEDPDLREELSSPLNPTDLEERGKVLDLMKKNMYEKTNQVSLVKKKNLFRWKVDLGTILAEFSNEDHRLKKFNLQNNGQIEVTTGDYILFDGLHELPKVIIFKGNNDRVYKIRIISLKHYQTYKKTFSKELKSLSKLENEVKENGVSFKEHPLIL